MESLYLHLQKNEDDGNKWHTVGIFKDVSQIINGYIDYDDWNIPKFKGTLTSENIPDLDAFKKVPLEPGTPYRFRLAALNACGRGDYGDVRSRF